MDGRVPGLSLILPAYNEEAGIRAAIAEADEALARLAEDYEVLVVDDGSRDATAAAVLAEAAGRPHVRLLRHEGNRGYGAALRSGFEAARFDLVAFTDADCQFHLDDLAPLLCLAEQHPIAVGYRVGRQDPWPRRLYSWGFNLLARALLGTRVRDCDCALKVFRRDTLARLLPETTGFFVNTEMLTKARQLGLDVAEHGVRHRPRLRGRSSVSLVQVPRVLAALLPFWWSRVLFPGAVPSRRPERSPLCPLLVLLVAVALFFSRLDAPLLEPQEARYAEIPRQMLEQGTPEGWLTPVLHGRPYLEKPPLLYWLVMLSYSAFGVHDWAARLVPGAAGCLTVFLLFLWGRRMAGERAALAGALILCLSVRFVYLGRMLSFDILLCLFVTAALAAAHRALGYGGRRWWLLAGLACGLGLLAKGPVALALVAGPVLVFAAMDSRAARPGWGAWGLFLGAAAALAAPWYVFAAVRYPGFLHDFLWRHNFLRYAAPFDHVEPPWFYLPGVLLGMLPWTLLLPGLVRFLFRHSRRVARQRTPALGFCLLSGLWGLLFFSLAGCKRAVYVLPALPPLALVLGCYLDTLLPRWQAGAASWASLLRPGGGPLARRATLLVLALGSGAGLLGVVAGMFAPLEGLALAAGSLAAGLVLWTSGRRTSWGHCVLATFALLFVGVQVALPAYNHRFGLRTVVEVYRDDLSRDAGPVPVACYPHGFESVSFYLRRGDIRIYEAGQRSRLIADLHRQRRTLLFVRSGRPVKALLRALPDTVAFEPERQAGVVVVGWVRVRRPAP
jgi:dolichol-phosphate mannosyltransferase